MPTSYLTLGSRYEPSPGRECPEAVLSWGTACETCEEECYRRGKTAVWVTDDKQRHDVLGINRARLLKE